MQNNKWNVLDTANLQMSSFQVSVQISALDWQLNYNNNGQRALSELHKYKKPNYKLNAYSPELRL